MQAMMLLRSPAKRTEDQDKGDIQQSENLIPLLKGCKNVCAVCKGYENWIKEWTE